MTSVSFHDLIHSAACQRIAVQLFDPGRTLCVQVVRHETSLAKLGRFLDRKLNSLMWGSDGQQVRFNIPVISRLNVF